MEVKPGKANLFTQAQQATSDEAKVTGETKSTLPLSSMVTEKKVPTELKKTVNTEFQMSASATQAQLRIQLEQKAAEDASLPDLKQNSDNEIVASNIQAKSAIESGHELEKLKLTPDYSKPISHSSVQKLQPFTARAVDHAAKEILAATFRDNSAENIAAVVHELAAAQLAVSAIAVSIPVVGPIINSLLDAMAASIREQQTKSSAGDQLIATDGVIKPDPTAIKKDS